MSFWNILHNRIEKIVFKDSMKWTRIIPYNERYMIFISFQQPLEEQEAGLIHEICHAYYRVVGVPKDMSRFGHEIEKWKK